MNIVVVSDTTAINYLILIGVVDVLRDLFGSVYVPRAVLEKLAHPRAPKPRCEAPLVTARRRDRLDTRYESRHQSEISAQTGNCSLVTSGFGTTNSARNRLGRVCGPHAAGIPTQMVKPLAILRSTANGERRLPFGVPFAQYAATILTIMLRLTRILLLASALASPGLAQFQPRIALCGAAGSATACQWSTVQTTLQATGLFATVDIIDVTTAGGGTPTLGRLMNYDALLCWTNTTPADNNAWGDVLADYVDAGGGVVVAVFANSSLTTGRNIGGRWQNGYEVVLDQSGNASGSGATLGTVLVPTHPVMAGVTAFAGGTTGSRPAGTALEVGATLIAEWSDGKVLVAEGANPSRIDLGFYPPPASCSQSGWSVGGDTLMANALLAVSGMASFGPYGAGCTGSLGVPSWTAQPGSRPSLGNVLLTDISNVPFGIAVVGLGLSAETSGALPLPLDLGSIGMPGCMLLADPIFTDVASGAAPTVTWVLFVPNNTALIGYKLFGQTFPLDAAVNTFGLTASNGARINVGL